MSERPPQPGDTDVRQDQQWGVRLPDGSFLWVQEVDIVVRDRAIVKTMTETGEWAVTDQVYSEPRVQPR